MTEELSVEEQWRDVPGYEGLYQVSDQGRVRSLPFKQRYLLRTGAPAWRTTKARILAQQTQNSGYRLVHLHRGNKRKALTVHRLVAAAFVPGHGRTVNHLNGVKTDNNAGNLEWASYTKNLLHAVKLRLNRQARPVRVESQSGVLYVPSMAQAARAFRTSIAAIKRRALTGLCIDGGVWGFA